MDTWSFWRNFVILFTFCEVYVAEKDVLEFFHPKDENPNELNEFLLNVQQHKNDFAFIREAAQHLKTKKSTELVKDDSGVLGLYYDALDMDNDFKTENKRHVHGNSNRNQYKYYGSRQIKLGNKNRYRRSENLQQQNFDYVELEPRGKIGEVPVTGDKYGSKFKKEALDLTSSGVHRTMVAAQRKLINVTKKNDSNDYSPVDLIKSSINVNKNEKNDDNMKSLVEPGDYFHYNENNFEKVEPFEVETAGNFETLKSNALIQQDMNNFDKINNSPDGNNLYSVDAGQAGRIEDYNMPVPNGKTYAMVNNPINNMNVNENYQKADIPYKNMESIKRFNFLKTSTSDFSLDVNNNGFNENNNPPKPENLISHGFIEISKNLNTNKIGRVQVPRKIKEQEEKQENNKWHNVFDDRRRRYDERNYNLYQTRNRHRRMKRNDVKNSGPFYSRRLHFIDDEMIDFGVNENEDYDPLPHRARRDFLDALGMRNEEDYSEDNPYIKELTANVTSAANDTRIKNKLKSTEMSSQDKNNDNDYEETDSEYNNSTGGKEEIIQTTTCIMSLENTPSTKLPFTKNDISDIQQVLEEPQLTTGEATLGEGFKQKEKREKTQRFSKVKDFVDIEENEERKTRDVSKEQADNKILMEQNYIMNRPNNRFLGQYYPKKINELRNVKLEESTTSGYDNSKLKFHKIDKKEDMEAESITPTSHCVESTKSTTAYVIPYGQIVQQIDEENEKLAKVVNGRVASKIVSTVFDELKSRSDLKNKFYPGLSRKHVNFDGKVDVDVFRSFNETQDDAAEARNLLDEITRVLNRLVITQVRRKLCQRLPDELRDYLSVIVNVKNAREAESFVSNPDQGNYLFKDYKAVNDFPFEIKQLQATLVALESLLLSYHKMNNDCQNRAEPVRDYIENHVNMLRKVMAGPTNSYMRTREVEKKRETPRSSDLIEEQLESIGLGKNHKSFVPNFDANKLVKIRLENGAVDNSDLRMQSKRDAFSKFNRSEKYRKLQRAVQQIRQKRENNRKIGELFGEKHKQASADLDANFEKPLIYSLK